MTLHPQEIQARFRRHAVRVTRQRAAIYAALVEGSSHPTADDLYRMVTRQHPAMSRNTVYYTLGGVAEGRIGAGSQRRARGGAV
jgi:Fur family peroxide stress response transcriptional regulator